MLQSLRQISILNRVFNIRGTEWSRVFFALFLKFLYRASFVIGWTVLVGLFVSRYGILSLPYLFVINAVFSIIGSVVFALFFEKFSRVMIMIGSIGISSILLFIAAFLASNEILFFSFFIVTVSIFLNQLRIILIAYVEELFDPLTSERAFPIIEVSETLGGIVAGILVTFLSAYFGLANFIYLMIGILLLMIPCLLFYDSEEKIALIHKSAREKHSVGIFSQLKAAFDSKVHASFILGLVTIVLLQWIIFNLLEFQYTKSVYQNVSNVIIESGSGFEHAFIHDLGLLFVIFNVSALVVEIFLGSRLISGLGVVGAMLLHPIVTLFSLFGLVVRPDFLTAVLAKNNFTMTSVIHTNTYHISYYAIREKNREHIREFLEGLVRPLGALLGTLIVILLQKFFLDDALVTSLNVMMILSTLLFLLVTYRQQDKYTKVVTEELLNSSEKHVRLSAIDLLAQKGHKVAILTLKKLLADPKELTSVKVKILGVFGELKSAEVILDIIECLYSDKTEVCEAAVDALMSYEFLHHYSKDYLFIKYKLISALKRLYAVEKDKELLAKVIYLMSLLSNVTTVEFLLKILDGKQAANKAEAIYALGRCKDDMIAKILEDYLHSKNAVFQINAAMALVNFDKFRDEALHLINSFIYSDKKERIVNGLFAIGELGLKNKRFVCMKYLNSEDVDLKMHSALALAKMGFYHSVSSILDLLFSGEEHVVKKLRSLIKNVDVRIYKNIDKIVRQIVSNKIEDLRLVNKNAALEGFSVESLTSLKKLYALIDEYEEIDSINSLLKNNI